MAYPSIAPCIWLDDQAEVDRFRDALPAGGKPGRCAWLQDRFGLSWQVAPRRMEEWMIGADAAVRDRVFAAMLPMGKIDLAALERAAVASDN